MPLEHAEDRAAAIKEATGLALEGWSLAEREEGVAKLLALGPVIGGRKALAALTKCLSDPELRVREAAIAALPQMIVSKNTFLVVQALCNSARSDRQEVIRSSAILALSQVARGPMAVKMAKRVLASQEEDEDEAMLSMAHAVDTALTSVTDLEAPVREACAHTLSALTRVSDPETLSALVHLLEDAYEEVRLAAVRALDLCATAADDLAIVALIDKLDDLDVDVRQAVTKLLLKLVGRNDARVLQTLHGRLERRDPLRRLAAVSILWQLVPRNDVDAVVRTTRCLEDRDMMVRSAAVSALASLVEAGDPLALEQVASRLRNAENSIRRAALQALPQVAIAGDPYGAHVVAPCLDHPSDVIRQAGIEALSLLANGPCRKDGEVLDRGGRDVYLEEAAARLPHHDHSVKMSAAQALRSIAKQGEDKLVAVVATYTQHEDCFLRRFALRLLAEFANDHDEIALACASKCLEDSVPHVRNAAQETLDTLQPVADYSSLYETN